MSKEPAATRNRMDAEDVARLRRAINRLSRQFNSSATDEGLTPTQASVLALTAARGPITVGELVRLEHLNPTMVSRLVAKLDGLGLISRTQDPDDGRSANLLATRKGRALHERIRDQRAVEVGAGTEQLSRADIAAIAAALPALERLADALQDP